MAELYNFFEQTLKWNMVASWTATLICIALIAAIIIAIIGKIIKK